MIIDDKHICPNCNKRYRCRMNSKCPNCNCLIYYDNEAIGNTNYENRYAWFYTKIRGVDSGHWHRVCSLTLLKVKGDRKK